MKQRIGQIGNIPLVIGDEHEVTSNEILVEQSKTDPNKIDIKRRINGKLKTLTSSEQKTKIVQTKRHKVGKFIHYIRPATHNRGYSLPNGKVFTVPYKTFYCEVTLDDGIHFLCPRFAFTVSITNNTDSNNICATQYDYDRMPIHLDGSIDNNTWGLEFYDKILYIIFKYKKEVVNIVQIDTDEFPDTLLTHYLYYTILVQDSKVVSEGTSTKYSLSAITPDYLHIPYTVEYKIDNNIGLQDDNDIFIDNLVYAARVNLSDQVLKGERYFKILKEYIDPNGSNMGSLLQKLTRLVKKPLGFNRARPSIKTPFFTVEVNPCYLEKEIM